MMYKIQAREMQTHPYACVNSTESKKSRTMYSKLFSSPYPLPLQSSSKKIHRRKRITEIHRHQGIEERAKYLQLIQMYRSKTLAQTAALFKQPKRSPKNSDIPVIDLCTPGTDLKCGIATPVAKSTPIGAVSSDNMRADESFVALSTKHFAAKQDSIDGMIGILPTIQRASVFGLPTSQNAGEASNSLKFSPTESAEISNPGTKSTPEKFRPSSPFLSKSFVEDLNSTYGRRERERQRAVLEAESRARVLRATRELKEEQICERLRARLSGTLTLQEAIAELSEEAKLEVDRALIPHPAHQVLVEAFNISITRRDMNTLAGLNWLNDEVINFYMEMIVARSREKDKSGKKMPVVHTMNTFFYPKLSKQGHLSVRRWTRRVDVFAMDLVIFPIHLGIHWTLAAVDFRTKEISYYDSMGGDNQKCLDDLKQYLTSEHEDKKKSAYDVSDWSTVCKSSEVPQQQNGSDCGVFTCVFAEFLARDAAFSFSQGDMPLLRRTMAWEILSKSLTR